MSLRTTIIKKIIRLKMSGWADGSIEEQRAKQEKTTKVAIIPEDVKCQPVDVEGTPAEWIEIPGADLGVLLYLHGGGYALGSIDTHRELIARLARATQLRGLPLDYRLAPEHPFPAALEDAVKAYRWLLAQGFEPGQVFIAGDSAGGGLALATLVNLREAGVPLPAGAICLSPWTDLALTGTSIHSKAKADPMLDPESLYQYVEYYVGEYETTNPLISPLYADVEGLPPLLIQVGADEILLDDATRFAEKARKSGVDATLEVWDEMFHVFQITPFLTEAKQAVNHIAEFVSRNS
ncbi:MAG: alpha/beta hydrolase [Chloroflexota bacterium]|nr:alpha/beta hydrolase [Chloroflexota bacterium]